MSSRRTRAHEAMRRLLERGRAQVRGAFEETPAQRAYRGAFEAEAGAAPARALDLEACAAEVAAAPAVLLGTFHTCPEVPRGLARLVARLPAAPGGEVWLLPFVRAERDELLADYAQGWDSEEFLEELDDLDPWPFERWAYKPLLEAARARGARLLGVADLPAGSPPMARAEADAARLAEHAGEGTRLVALVGEHHLALEHLPTRLATRLEGDPGSFARLVHDAPEAFLLLEEEGDAPAACRLESGMIALYAAAPYRLYESFESWRRDAPELPYPLRAPWRGPGEPDLAGVLERAAALMQDNLEVDLGDLGPRPWGEVVTPESLEELTALALDDAGLDEVLGQLAQGRGYFLPGIPAVVLPGAQAGPAAEEIAHAWNFALTGPEPGERPPAEDLRARILREAVGFYGSLALVPDRPAWHPDDGVEAAGPLRPLAELLLESLGPRGLELPDELADQLWRDDLEAYLGLAHLAGYVLGGAWGRTPEVAAEVLRLGPAGDGALRAAWERAWQLAAE